MSSDPYLTPDKPARGVTPEPGIPGVDVPPGSAAELPAVPPKDAEKLPPAPKPESAVHFTRAAALWSALIVGLLILIVLLVFITQNTESVQMTFIGWHWSLPLGVQILLAAVLGALITVMAGTVRIYQLRRAAKKNLKAGPV